MALHARDVNLNVLPLFHIGGLAIMASCFYAGAMSVNLSRFDAEKAARLTAEKKASVLFDFAPILGSLLEQSQKDGTDLRSLQKVVGLDSPETIRAYQDRTKGCFYAFFGQTETSCLATIGPYNHRPGSAGQPVFAGEVTVVDDADRPVEMAAPARS